MTHDVFISHSSKDKPVADAVCAHLEAAGVRCWIAPRDIAPGEDWPTAITMTITQSRIMLLIFSASSNSSEDVSRELFLASNSKLIIIPFKIEDIEPEPGKQYYLASTHWLDAMNPPTNEQIKLLVGQVRSILSAINPDIPVQVVPVREELPLPMVRSAPGHSRRNFYLYLIAAALVVLGIFMALLNTGRLNRLAATPVPTLAPTLAPSETSMPSGPTAPANPNAVDASQIAGVWTGSAANGSFQIQITITVVSTCIPGQVCAHFDNPTLPCSGDFAFIKMTNGMYEFQAEKKQGTCGIGKDFLQGQPDGSLLYLSQGDFGETRGLLHRQ